MSANEFNDYLFRLSCASMRQFMDPGKLDWPDGVNFEQWHFTPELISLHGTEVWKNLDEATRKKLSFYEAANFFSLNIHGEKYLISEISRQLFQGEDPKLSRYLLHFMEEEAKHMMYFSSFCNRYAGKVYPDRTLRLESSEDSELEWTLLFLRIYLFEEIVDEYNQVMAKDERVSPIAREINRIHHVEESRHLAFGRKFIQEQLKRVAGDGDDQVLRHIRAHLAAYQGLTWKQYYNPDVYEDAGVPDAFAAWQQAFESQPCRAHRDDIAARRLGLMYKLGVMEPAT